jgi:hypothetical protein
VSHAYSGRCKIAADTSGLVRPSYAILEVCGKRNDLHAIVVRIADFKPRAAYLYIEQRCNPMGDVELHLARFVGLIVI